MDILKKFVRILIPFLTASFVLNSSQTQACEEGLSLAERRDQADVIINGIPTSTSEDSAEVQIVQILRDRFSILESSVEKITVLGLDNPDICKGTLSVNLVQIIPLTVKNVDNEYEFYLNSSVVDVSIDSLKIIREGSEVKEDRCDKKVCPVGKICQISEAKEAECICEPCLETEEYSPICATNNIVYPNKCQMDLAACRLDSEISVLKEGFCDDPCSLVRCGYGAKCVPSSDRKTATCECSDVCPKIYSPVCASNGQEFSNNCEMENFICRNQIDLTTRYESACNPCNSVDCPENTKCKVDAKTRAAVCSCGEKCLAEVNTVCGSDGYDYTNECELQRHSCLLNRKIEIAARHSCRDLPTDPCSVTTCSNYAECMRSGENPSIAECSCPFVCDPIYEPVCGLNEYDGSLQQFDSECLLKQTSCTQQREITLISRSRCGDSSEISKESICKGVDCTAGTECSIDKTNKAKCDCAESCSEFGYSPICGSDGRTYPNLCELRRSACLNGRDDLEKIRDSACPNACNGVQCENHAECRTDIHSGKAQCVCPNQCSLSDLGTEKVCGSDGESYQNLCEMKKVSCQTKKEITVSYYGLCFTKDLCESKICHKYATCQKGTCICENCDEAEKDLICGSDENNYKNECELRKKSCEQDVNISVQHYGTCLSNDESHNDNRNASQKLYWKCSEKCMHGACHLVDKVWQCICPKCNDEPQINTLCGEDNKTYRSKCHLKQEMCMKQKEIGILHYGSCDQVQDCPVNSEIIRLSNGDGFLSCNNDQHCPVSSYCYVGNCCFYRSEATINCSTTVYGCCEDQKTFALGARQQGCPENCLCNALGSYGNRCDMFNQCVCRKGVTGKRCDRCSHGFWNFTRMRESPSLGCQECNCNVNGSQRTDCDQSTGECLCKQGVFGKKCDLCPSDLILSPSGCVSQKKLDSQKFYSSCDGVVCEHGATCVHREHYAQCECPVACPKESENSPVICGSDGRTYIHECDMTVKACAKGKTLTVSYYGACSVDTLIYEHPETKVIVEVPLSDGSLNSEDLDKCKALGCKHGGQCVQSSSQDFNCLCPVGTGGKRCEQQMSIKIPKFKSNSYLKFPEIELDTENTTVSISINPTKEDGLIFYIGSLSSYSAKQDLDKSFVAVFLEKELLKLRTNIEGSSGKANINMPVIRSQWYKVTVSFSRNIIDFSVKPSKIDGFLKNFKMNSKTSIIEGSFGSEFYVGGLPMTAGKSAMKQLGLVSGFSGCMTDVWVNGFEIDLSYPDSKTLIEGYGIESCAFNPCENEPCQNEGTCIVEDSFSYWCVCKIGFQGKNCDYANNPCRENPCQNGGICQQEKVGFKCFCPLGTKGETCEKVVKSKKNEIFMPSFNTDSYMRTSEIEVSDHIDIEVWLFTRKLKGLLFFTEQESNFMFLEIDSHMLTFRSNIGIHSISLVASEKLKSHTWYQISISGKGDNFEMQVGKSNPQRVVLQSHVEKFAFKGPLYVGTLPNFSFNSFIASKHGFRGLIQFLKVNGKVLIGNKTVDQLSKNFDRYFNVIGWRNHDCYETERCKKYETCLPELDSFKCECRQAKCRDDSSDNDKTVTEKTDYARGDESSSNQLDGGEHSFAFDGKRSYVIYNAVTQRITSQSHETYQFSFRTKSQNGVIFWSKEDSLIDYFVVGLWNGYLHLEIELGAGDTQIFSVNQLNDGKWHQVSIERTEDWVALKVDTEPIVTSYLFKGASKLDTNGLIYIGGLPPYVVQSSVTTVASPSTSEGFQGCLQSIIVNNQPVNFYTNELTKNTVVKPCM